MPPAIYTYTAAATGLFVNSYLVETDDGVVAIDAGLLVSDARAFRARLDALHKPLLAVLVTHDHPPAAHRRGLPVDRRAVRGRARRAGVRDGPRVGGAVARVARPGLRAGGRRRALDRRGRLPPREVRQAVRNFLALAGAG